jgi:hypothetical protein
MSDPLPCTGCQKILGDHSRRPGSLCLLAQGDERILSWWLCEACGVYTRREYVDSFHGDSEVHRYGPFSKEVGDADLQRVANCPTPDEKYCKCETHRYFGG